VSGPHIFRWDLDKTYLKTDFDSVRDLVKTARLTAEQRQNVPGAAALIRAIRDDPGPRHKIYFISGSPAQLRPVLEQKFALDGFEPDGFVLKPTLGHMMRGQFRAVRGQVAYKLTQLLLGRADAPVGTPETLFGDDAEADAFIYALYADVLAGRVDRRSLRIVLRATGAYPFQVEEVEEALRWVVHEDPVRRILIHLELRTPPVEFAPYGPRCIPIHGHLQTALALVLDRTLGPDVVRMVTAELVERYDHQPRALANLAEDLVRRHPEPWAPEVRARLLADFDRLIGDATTPVMDALTAMRERVARIPVAAGGAPVASPPRDYLALWKAMRARRIARRRAARAAPPADPR
jgi:hypothetical protein